MYALQTLDVRPSANNILLKSLEKFKNFTNPYLPLEVGVGAFGGGVEGKSVHPQRKNAIDKRNELCYFCSEIERKQKNYEPTKSTTFMNYQALSDAAMRAAAALGYHPTSSENLHATLRHEGFPIAVIGSSKVLSAEGVKEVEVCQSLELKLLTHRCMNPAESAEVLAQLTDDAMRLSAALLEESSVLEVTLEEVAPEEQLQTLAGEEAIRVRLKLRSLECNV